VGLGTRISIKLRGNPGRCFPESIKEEGSFIKLNIALGNRRITGIVSQSWQNIYRTFIDVLVYLLPVTAFLNMFQCLPVTAGYNL
jgi:hypothetical protein